MRKEEDVGMANEDKPIQKKLVDVSALSKRFRQVLNPVVANAHKHQAVHVTKFFRQFGQLVVSQIELHHS
jgi:hypothetical protein